MELFIAIFIGAWLCAASIVSYFWLKKEFKPYIDKAEKAALQQAIADVEAEEGER